MPSGRRRDFLAPTASVVETVQNIAVQQPAETNISPIIEKVLPPVPQLALPILEQDSPTLVRSMTFFEAENQEMSD